MRYLQQIWHYLCIEPYRWLFYSFFQPARFKHEYESKGLLHRFQAMVRLVLPVFLVAYPLALLLYMIVQLFDTHSVVSLWLHAPSLDSTTLSNCGFFLLLVALVAFFAILWSMFWGIAGGIAGGIAWGMTLSLASGIAASHIVISNIINVMHDNTGLNMTLCILFGLPGGVVGSITGLILAKRNSRVTVGIGGIAGGIAGGIVGKILIGIAWAVSQGNKTSAIGIIFAYLNDNVSLVGCIAGGLTEVIAKPMAERRSTAVSLMAARIGGITGASVFGINALLDIVFFHVDIPLWEWIGITAGNIIIGIAGGIVGSAIVDILETEGKSRKIVSGLMMFIAGILFLSITVLSLTSMLGITLMIIMGLLLGIIRPSTISIILGISFAIGRIENLQFFTPEAILEALVLIGCIVIGRLRLPLYPISMLSALLTYVSSSNNPREVFSFLHRSSLYWDECSYLPLPGLKQTLLIAAEQESERTLTEIRFILAERPQQLSAARAASLEIAIDDLEKRTMLREIADATRRLNEILPQDAGLIDPRWVTPFARLSDVSLDAERACSPLGWQARRQALQDMIAGLNKVYPNMAFTNEKLNARLAAIITTWRAVAQYHLTEMEKAPERTSRIGNPYNPGPALDLRDSLFVGRRDLAQQLGDALERGTQRSTFLLHGERRFGKTSTLKQLPDLLGARYIPVFYDLQMRGYTFSIAAFLGKIADGIYKVMRARGLSAKRLSYEKLQDASKRNDAEVYYLFERWLEEIEETLEQEHRTLLLTFDEFEKLEEAGRDGFLNLNLLLDWFRSTTQNHPRLALLFSGVRSFGEMGNNWAGYFVNVQTLKISFLRSDEAYQLITRPAPDFPGERIFSKNVIEGIMRVTNCHPFLVQAMCSALLTALNVSNQDRILPHEVGIAANQVLQSWGSTYFRDQWARTDEDQRACVSILNRIGSADRDTIAVQSGLESRHVHDALETLLDRDIVSNEHGRYKIAVPLFGVWVQRNNR